MQSQQYQPYPPQQTGNPRPPRGQGGGSNQPRAYHNNRYQQQPRMPPPQQQGQGNNAPPPQQPQQQQLPRGMHLPAAGHGQPPQQPMIYNPPMGGAAVSQQTPIYTVNANTPISVQVHPASMVSFYHLLYFICSSLRDS